MRRYALAVLLLATASGLARAQDTSAVARAVPPVPAVDTIREPAGVLRPGDELHVIVYRSQELTNKYLIDSRGFVNIPGIGALRAAGLTPAQMTDALREALVAQGFTEPGVAVQPLIRLSVLGDVRSPGLYPVDPSTSLIQLLTLAGGPTERADLRRTRVVRNGKVYVVDLESALSGSAAGRIVLYSGDVVVVPTERGFTRETLSLVLAASSTVLALVNVLLAVR